MTQNSTTTAPAPPAEARTQARIAGLAYMMTIVAGMFAEAYVRGSIRSIDPVQTAERLSEFQQLHRFGILADGVMLISYIVVTALLYRLFKPVSATVALLAAFFSLIGIAVLAASLTILVLPLQLAGASIAGDALRAHSAAYSLTGLFFGPYCGAIGWLAIRSRWLPASIGWLMCLAGAAFVFDAVIDLVAPVTAQMVPAAVMLISLIAEGSLAIWLASVGVRQQTRAAQA